jgi:molybdenum-dependent oxidoreductase-like protein
MPVTRMRPKAMFTGVPHSVRAGAEVVLGGMAWSGEGVARVQVGIGRKWTEARLVGPALPHAWRRFEMRWTPPRPGTYRLCCRAFDESGAGQPEEPLWNEQGYGANGIQHLQLEVR